jgi:hypothetical protein
VDAGVVAKLGVEGGGEEVALADEGGVAVAGGEDFDVGADPIDAGGADKNHLEGAAGEGGGLVEDGGVVLAAVGVALDGDVEGGEGLLGGAGDVGGEEDGSGTGSEGGFLVDEGVEYVEEVAALEELEHGGGLATGDNEGVQAFELGGQTYQAGGGSQGGEDSGVDVVGALKREDADDQGLGWVLGRLVLVLGHGTPLPPVSLKVFKQKDLSLDPRLAA